MASETERAIERLREVEHYGSMSIQWDDVKTLLAEHDRLKAELERLTAGTDAGNTLEFVPLPTPRPPEESKA